MYSKCIVKVVRQRCFGYCYCIMKRLWHKGAVLREDFVESMLTVPVALLLVLCSVLLRVIQCNKETILLETVKDVS